MVDSGVVEVTVVPVVLVVDSGLVLVTVVPFSYNEISVLRTNACFFTLGFKVVFE